MEINWLDEFLVGIFTINQILTAGIAITAFSLFFYSLSFNLRNRVARSFAIILLCVVVVFTSEALESSSVSPEVITFFLQLEWVGIIFLPAAYLHFSDAILVTTGRPSRGRRRIAVRFLYFLSLIFLILLASGNLLGPVILENNPAPHLERTVFTEIFTIYYVGVMAWAWINFGRSFKYTLTRSGKRRMIYLIAGATAPAIGSFPYLLYGSGIAENHPYLFWGVALLNNLIVGGLIILMAYAVAFFGVSWPDRIVKSRLFKWIMRGPVTASITLGVMTIVKRAGEYFGFPYSGAVPTSMVVVVLLMEHTITLVAPMWERWIFFGNDRTDLLLLQKLEERLITRGDLRQFLEAIIAAIRDHLQSGPAFIAAFNNGRILMLISNGSPQVISEDKLDEALEVINTNNKTYEDYYLWNDHLIFPLFQEVDADSEESVLIGLVGASVNGQQSIQSDQRQALDLLLQRAAQALQDNVLQEKVFSSLKELQPQVDLFQKWRAVGRFDSKINLLKDDFPPEPDFANWVKDALTHYWGGPRLSKSPLLQLRVVKKALDANENPSNALRVIIKQAMESIKPYGDRRFTAEWILYNILELKFIEGWKVRDIAARLAMSEADFYRKQRVAIEEIARVIREMEHQSK
ncbi:histidine kinase N-terminal 7TM domain-containing protein [Chloroflexota bacterium]